MAFTISSGYRSAAVGAVAAALLVGAFSVGAEGRASSATSSGGTGNRAAAVPAAAASRITVTGTGTVTGTPDQLLLSMSVQTKAPTVDAALQQANRVQRRVTAALRAAGVAAADIQTSNLSLQPGYSQSSQLPDGYSASESLTATLRRIGQAGSQIQQAVAAGGNAATVDGISLNLTDTSQLLASARQAAVSDARVKAAQYARALGRALGPVISITDGGSPQPIYQAVPSGLAASGKSVPISPGSQQLSVSVTVVYAV